MEPAANQNRNFNPSWSVRLPCAIVGGVHYYGFAQALLIEQRLDFRADWLRTTAEFRQAHADAQGRLSAAAFTSTGHIDNHYSIGPAIGRVVRGMLDAGQVTTPQ